MQAHFGEVREMKRKLTAQKARFINKVQQKKMLFCVIILCVELILCMNYRAFDVVQSVPSATIFLLLLLFLLFLLLPLLSRHPWSPQSPRLLLLFIRIIQIIRIDRPFAIDHPDGLAFCK